MKKIGLTLLTAFVGGAMALGTYKVFESKYADNMSFEDKQKVYFANNPIASNITSSAGEVDFTQAAAAVTPAVVYIRTTYSNTQSNDEQDRMSELFGEFFGQRIPRSNTPQRASGSGVIISTDGYIVTNNHVVSKADKIEVTLNDHRVFSAKIIGTDPNTDLALIKVEGNNLPIVKLGNSDDARVGEWVLAVGNPFNLTSTVTAGIVSAKGRGIGILGRDEEQQMSPFGSRSRRQADPSQPKAAPIESFIQTDAAINPGNSGGALVNTKGELIGINSAIASHTGSYEGYGFAVPINLAKKVLNDIKEFGVVKRGFIGVNFVALNTDEAKKLNIDRNVGLYVANVNAGSGAEQAGLKQGDIITKVEGNTVYESSDLQERVGRLQPGDKIRLTVLRDGAEKNFTVTLKENSGTPAERTAAVSRSSAELFNRLGGSFAPTNQSQKNRFRINGGVAVTQVRPGGLLDENYIEPGTIITSINRQPVNSRADVEKALSNLKSNKVFITGYDTEGMRFNGTFSVE